MVDAKLVTGLGARVDAAIDRAIAEKRIVGTVLLVAREGELIYSRAAGLADREAGRPMTFDAIFRLASCTKPLVAAAALAMVDAGLIGLDDEVSRHLPYFTPKFEGRPARVLVRHLLTHTSGLSYDADDLRRAEASGGMSGPILPLEENVRRLGTIPLRFEPGTRWIYGTSIDVVGCLVGTLSKSTVDAAIRRYVTGPLGMADTRFGVTDIERLATPYADGRPDPVRMGDTTYIPARTGTGGTTFCPSRIFNPLAPQSGGSGMAGSAPDFMRFLEMVRGGGGKVLKRETVAAACRNQIGGVPMEGEERIGERFGFFGAIVDDTAMARTPQARGTLRWGGVYGHNWFIDPAAGLCAVSFSNSAFEGCNGPYREEIRDAIYGANG
jgi:CubicO group peptidase (beta-lactamase class C family)